MGQSVLRIMCPNLKCRTVLGVPAKARGKLVRCRMCGTSIKIPASSAKAPSGGDGGGTASGEGDASRPAA